MFKIDMIPTFVKVVVKYFRFTETLNVYLLIILMENMKTLITKLNLKV